MVFWVRLLGYKASKMFHIFDNNDKQQRLKVKLTG